MDCLHNIAYTEEYLNHLANIDRYLFRPECFTKEAREELDGIIIVTRDFSCKNHPDYPRGVIGSENDVIVDGNIIYSFHTLNESGSFWSFVHQNGKRYLLFKQNLYGYSVLDIATGQDYRYYPKGSFPGGETWIWMIPYYNAQNNILAIDGCYWACPSSITLADFSDPMKETIYLDVNEYHGEGYPDLEFVRWNGTDLVGELRVKKSKTEVVIPEAEYTRWFEEAKKHGHTIKQCKRAQQQDLQATFHPPYAARDKR